MVTATRFRLWYAVQLLAGGCSFLYGDDLDKKQCKRDSDCARLATGAPLVCRSNACQAPVCAADPDCPMGSSCVESICMPKVTSDAGMVRAACTQDVQCGEGSRCGFDGFCYEKWGCLRQDRDWPPAAQSFTFRIVARQITDLENPGALPALDVVACTTIDPTCNRPAVRKEDVTITADKLVSVPFTGVGSAGFTGSIRFDPVAPDRGGVGVDAADAGMTDGQGSDPRVLPALLHFTAENPLVGNMRAQSRLLTIDDATYALLATIADVKLDIASATVAVTIHDCGGRPAAGVSMRATGVPSATFVPIQNESAPVVGGTRTTSEGTAIIINIPPDRNQLFQLRDEETGRLISDTITFVPRGGALNYLLYYPRYRAVEQWHQQARRQGLLTER